MKKPDWSNVVILIKVLLWSLIRPIAESKAVFRIRRSIKSLHLERIKLITFERIRNSEHFQKYKKVYYTSFVTSAAVVVFCTVYLLILPAITASNNTTTVVSHPCLSYMMYGNTSSSAYRAYYEYALPDDRYAPGSEFNNRTNATFGILRQSVLYVYAYAGETIYLGSDIVHSRIDIDDYRQSDETGVDIIMIGPDGTKYTFDNDNITGLGYIGNTTMEKAGPNFAGSNNVNGYTPHEFTVRQTGIYEVRFHSFDGYCQTTQTSAGILTTDGYEPHLKPEAGKKIKVTNGVIVPGDIGNNASQSRDPAIVKLSAEDWSNNGATVGTFDVTVVGDGQVKTGRTYADYLSLNMGSNVSPTTLYGDFYMVTGDGYIYESKFDLDPYGFIFFANNRGVVSTETGYSAYRSVKAWKQITGTQEMDMHNIPFAVFAPNNESTSLDNTCMIFFEEPDPALQGTVYQRAFAPDKIESVEFIGSKEGNITYVGNGGYFKFEVENATSVSIKISFDRFNEAHGTDYKDIIVSANVTPGTNTIFWDGNDSEGNVVPIGWYKDNLLDLEVETHAGEYHFPFLDVENSSNLQFERVNRIYRYIDGELVDVTDEYDDTRYNVYYNNEIMPGKVNAPNAEIIADGLNCSAGVDSSQSNTMSFKNSQGDLTILDVWTYAIATNNITVDTDIIIENLDDYYVVNLDGLVFFDKDNSTAYNISGGDFPLKDVTVSLDYYYCGTRWGIVRDLNDPNKILKLTPAAANHSEEDEQGNPVEIIDYYYHDFELRADDEGNFRLYKYAFDDLKHEHGAEPVLGSDGLPKVVTVEPTTIYDEGTDTYSDNFLAWLPVHKETTTDNLGKYVFTGVLINKNMYTPPIESYDTIKVQVINPDEDLYELTTASAHTGDFDTNGTEIQILSMTDLQNKVNAELEQNSDKIVFKYSVADVGYYYDTYEPPVTVAKKWGSINDTNNITKITFTLQGYAEIDEVNHVLMQRTVSVDYYSWQKTLTDLPASAKYGGETVPLKYRIISEQFVKKEDDRFFRYTYTYYWDDAEPHGEYTKIEVDSNGNPLESSPNELEHEDYPFESYINPLENRSQGDYICVENWQRDTTLITLTKYGAEDRVTKLPLATFKLQRLREGSAPNSNDYEDVITELGVYTVTTDANGVAIFRGLSEGVYRIVETVSPEHYKLNINPIRFTVSRDGSTGNVNVTGNYSNGYKTDYYDELAEIPVSKIYKYDQYGNPVSGATFEAYAAAGDDYHIINDTPVFTVTTDGADGSATIFKTLLNGQQREMYISELKALLGDGVTQFVLRETEVPDGYRKVGDAHMRIIGSGMASYIICENPYDSGAWSSPSATVYAPESIQIADMNEYRHKPDIKNAEYISNDGSIDYVQRTVSGRLTSNGTLFAVILKRNGADHGVDALEDLTFDNWTPVYGDDNNGYRSVTGYDSTLEAVIEAINLGGAHTFDYSEEDDSMHVHLLHIPGNIDRYFTYHYQNPNQEGLEVNDKEPQYVVAYYFSTASDISQATEENTVRVTSHGLVNDAEPFPIHWATELKIPDISNALYVQKRDSSNTLVDNAVFALYDVVVDEAMTGYYIAESDGGGKIFVRLSEDVRDDELKANVYSGVAHNGMLLELSPLAENVPCTVNTTGCAELDGSLGYMNSEGTGEITVTVNGTDYIIRPSTDALDRKNVIYTHNYCDSINEYGTGHFRNLQIGNYFLREIYAPPGFELNYTNVEVIVSEDNVFANAGNTVDGVKVGNGVGYLVSTMNVFASVGDINETLSYIVAALHLDSSSDSDDGFVNTDEIKDWPYVSLNPYNTTKYIFNGNEPVGPIDEATVLYLRYNGYANGEEQSLIRRTLFDYCVNPQGAKNPANLIDSLTFWTESGWSDLGIFQHMTYGLKQNPPDSNTKFEDISTLPGEDGQPVPRDISNLFSSSTFVSFEDKFKADIKLNKVDMQTEAPLEGASFTMHKQINGTNYYYMRDEETGTTYWTYLRPDETPSTFEIVSGEDGIVRFDDIEPGEYFINEIKAPSGYLSLKYNLKVVVKGGEVKIYKNGDEIETEQSVNPDDDDLLFEFDVPNSSGYELPATGGSILLYFTFGALLTTAGVFMCGSRLRRKRERRIVG